MTCLALMPNARIIVHHIANVGAKNRKQLLQLLLLQTLSHSKSNGDSFLNTHKQFWPDWQLKSGTLSFTSNKSNNHRKCDNTSGLRTVYAPLARMRVTNTASISWTCVGWSANLGCRCASTQAQTSLTRQINNQIAQLLFVAATPPQS